MSTNSIAESAPDQGARANRFVALSIVLGFGTFAAGLFGAHPERAWQAYLINFLLWSAIAQGGLLFSAVMSLTKARWSGTLASLGESFAAFFPVSFVLFLGLYPGKSHLFPWIGQDLHGKEVWLNIPFLFSRDAGALLVLYALGFVYLYHALGAKLCREKPAGSGLRKVLYRQWGNGKAEPESFRNPRNVSAVLYILAFALVLSLIGYDLVMSMDPHWYSTLFGAYHFVKAVYAGLGAVIVLAAFLHLKPDTGWRIESDAFHDIGKLFFAFCLVWADFFYCQLVVIWYGNISEETAYVIERVMLSPWKPLAWIVFGLCFIVPFLILLRRDVKTQPKFMMGLCLMVILGIWLEHMLLLGPALSHHAESLPLGAPELLITVGFFGLMAWAVSTYLKLFPELEPPAERRKA